MNLHRYTYLRATDGTFKNPFDKGVFKNLVSFFCVDANRRTREFEEEENKNVGGFKPKNATTKDWVEVWTKFITINENERFYYFVIVRERNNTTATRPLHHCPQIDVIPIPSYPNLVKQIHRIRTASRSRECACGFLNYQSDETSSRTHHTRTVSRSCEYACAFPNYVFHQNATRKFHTLNTYLRIFFFSVATRRHISLQICFILEHTL